METRYKLNLYSLLAMTRHTEEEFKAISEENQEPKPKKIWDRFPVQTNSIWNCSAIFVHT